MSKTMAQRTETVLTFSGSLAAAGRDTTEFLLRPDTQYAYVFTSLDDDNAAQITLNWYEHTDSN